MQFAPAPQILSAHDGLATFVTARLRVKKKRPGFLDTNGNYHAMIAVEASWLHVEICRAYLPEGGDHPLLRWDQQKRSADGLLALMGKLFSTHPLSSQVPGMMGIANDGRWGLWVPRRMASRAMGPWMTSAADIMATYAVDWRSKYTLQR